MQSTSEWKHNHESSTLDKLFALALVAVMMVTMGWI